MRDKGNNNVFRKCDSLEIVSWCLSQSLNRPPQVYYLFFDEERDKGAICPDFTKKKTYVNFHAHYLKIALSPPFSPLFIQKELKGGLQWVVNQG